MLLPSAFDASKAGDSPRYNPQALFASPPSTPPQSSQPSTIFASSFALQSLLHTSSQAQSEPHSQRDGPPTPLLTPPTVCAPLPLLPPNPIKLRLRSRKTGGEESGVSARRITKRVAPKNEMKLLNKRRRSFEDTESSARSFVDLPHSVQEPHNLSQPSTPTRHHLAPEHLPLGLERADFRKLAEDSNGQLAETSSGENGEWSGEDDRLLVELVLEKLKLSKSDWQDCARTLGRDGTAVGRRWKSLMAAGEVGVKRRGRGRLCSTWR